MYKARPPEAGTADTRHNTIAHSQRRTMERSAGPDTATDSTEFTVPTEPEAGGAATAKRNVRDASNQTEKSKLKKSKRKKTQEDGQSASSKGTGSLKKSKSKKANYAKVKQRSLLAINAMNTLKTLSHVPPPFAYIDPGDDHQHKVKEKTPDPPTEQPTDYNKALIAMDKSGRLYETVPPAFPYMTPSEWRSQKGEEKPKNQGEEDEKVQLKNKKGNMYQIKPKPCGQANMWPPCVFNRTDQRALPSTTASRPMESAPP